MSAGASQKPVISAIFMSGHDSSRFHSPPLTGTRNCLSITHYINLLNGAGRALLNFTQPINSLSTFELKVFFQIVADKNIGVQFLRSIGLNASKLIPTILFIIYQTSCALLFLLRSTVMRQQCHMALNLHLISLQCTGGTSYETHAQIFKIWHF